MTTKALLLAAGAALLLPVAPVAAQARVARPAATPAPDAAAAGPTSVTPAISAADKAKAAGTWTPPPSHAELKALWEGGTWAQDIARGGGWMSGFKSAEEYGNPDFVPPNMVPLKPGPMAVYKNIRRQNGRGHQIFGPYAQCHPAGMPYLLTINFSGGYEVVVADDQLAFFYGAEHESRRIFIDGRPRPTDLPMPLYNGFSVAHWEGKTMVVETTDIRGSNTQIEPHLPKPEGSYIIERYTPNEPGKIALEMTMTNPEFTRPWVVKMVLTKDPKGKIIEMMCSDDNRWVMRNGELTLEQENGKPLEKAED